MTPYREHKLKWKDCSECELHERRTKVVLLRGKIPSPILFIGEAPGVSEDILGKPFVGPAGALLNQIIEVAIDGQFDYAITNLVGCFPRDNKDKGDHAPPKAAITACRERLQETVALCKPQLIICVGALAKKHVRDTVGPDYKGEYRDIVHPAAILRLGVMQKGLAIQRAEVVIEDALNSL